jgi:hypothetical protein
MSTSSKKEVLAWVRKQEDAQDKKYKAIVNAGRRSQRE